MAGITLDPRHKDDIESSIQRTYDLDEFLNRAELGGFNMTEQRKANAANRTQLLKIKQAFFSG